MTIDEFVSMMQSVPKLVDKKDWKSLSEHWAKISESNINGEAFIRMMPSDFWVWVRQNTTLQSLI